jgi:hypothetical protein
MSDFNVDLLIETVPCWMVTHSFIASRNASSILPSVEAPASITPTAAHKYFFKSYILANFNSFLSLALNALKEISIVGGKIRKITCC